MLKGVRWQKRITIIPGLLHINLSKSGVSASAGPRGADINIGRKGVTTSAGIPGTGLSYRQKMGGGRGMLGILLVIAGLGWWAFQHWSKVEKIIAPMRPAATQRRRLPLGLPGLPARMRLSTPRPRPCAMSIAKGRFYEKKQSLLAKSSRRARRAISSP